VNFRCMIVVSLKNWLVSVQQACNETGQSVSTKVNGIRSKIQRNKDKLEEHSIELHNSGMPNPNLDL